MWAQRSESGGSGEAGTHWQEYKSERDLFPSFAIHSPCLAPLTPFFPAPFFLPALLLSIFSFGPPCRLALLDGSVLPPSIVAAVKSRRFIRNRPAGDSHLGGGARRTTGRSLFFLPLQWREFWFRHFFLFMDVTSFRSRMALPPAVMTSHLRTARCS